MTHRHRKRAERSSGDAVAGAVEIPRLHRLLLRHQQVVGEYPCLVWRVRPMARVSDAHPRGQRSPLFVANLQGQRAVGAQISTALDLDLTLLPRERIDRE